MMQNVTREAWKHNTEIVHEMPNPIYNMKKSSVVLQVLIEWMSQI